MQHFRSLAAASLLIFTLSVPALASGRNEKFVGTTWQGVDSPLFGTVFTQLTPENAGKWGVAEPSQGMFRWSSLDALFALADRRKLVVKEHTVIWSQQQPPWVTADNAEQSVRDWMRALKERYGERIDLIDVVNEPLDGRPAYAAGLPGGSTALDWIVWAYQRAREEFPHAKLLINEYGILNSSSKTSSYVRLIKVLQQKKLIDGIGCQAHGLEHVSASTIRDNLKTLESLKLPIYISEWDLDQRDDAQQLEQMKTQFPVFWNDPAVRGVTFWDFVEGSTWKPDAYLVRTDGSYRPAFQWLVDYLKRG